MHYNCKDLDKKNSALFTKFTPNPSPDCPVWGHIKRCAAPSLNIWIWKSPVTLITASPASLKPWSFECVSPTGFESNYQLSSFRRGQRVSFFPLWSLLTLIAARCVRCFNWSLYNGDLWRKVPVKRISCFFLRAAAVQGGRRNQVTNTHTRQTLICCERSCLMTRRCRFLNVCVNVCLKNGHCLTKVLKAN